MKNSPSNKFKHFGLLLALVTIVVVACKKQNLKDDKLLNSYGSVTEIFQSIRKADLELITQKGDVFQAQALESRLAADIADFYFIHKKINLRNEFENSNQKIIVFGLIESAAERYRGDVSTDLSGLEKMQDSYPLQIPNFNQSGVNYDTTLLSPAGGSVSSSMGCFFTAVSTILGIAQSQNIWTSIVSGTYNLETAIETLALIGKRVAGVLAVATMIYAVGDCLDWWDIVPYDEDEINKRMPIEWDTTFTPVLDTTFIP